ncbi:MAG: type II secretion system protein [Puniceicoccales bacterium]
MKNLPLPRNEKASKAFALIELITVISIVLILAGILIPVVGIVREQSSRAIETSNLRQIGSMVLLYSHDHGDTLPGPLYPKQKPRYKELIVNDDGVRTKELTSMLAAYADLPLDGRQWRDFPLLSSPRFEAARESNGSGFATYSYLMQQEASDNDRQSPWGTISTDQPFTLAQLAERVDGQRWAMQALDMDNLPAGMNSSNVLADPVFEDSRATLYFDWHVDFVPIEN